MVTQLAQIHPFLAVLILLRHGHSEGGVDVADLLAVESAVSGGLLHVEDLSSKRKDGLDPSVASLLRRSAGGISLDKEDLALLRISLRAVGQLARHAGSRHRGLSLHHLAGLAGGAAGGGGKHDLLNYQLTLLRMLLKVLIHGRGSGLRHSGGGLRVTQLGLGLSLELRLGDLHGDHSRQTLTEILRSKVTLELREKIVLLGIVLQRARKTHLETLKMGTTLYGVDVVDVGIYLLGESVVVREGDVDRDHLVILHTHRLRDELRRAGVKIFNELLQTVLRIEDVPAVVLPACRLGVAVLVGDIFIDQLPLIGDGDPDAFVQVGELAHPGGEGVILVDIGLREYGRVRMEGDDGTGVVAVADNLHWAQRLAF